VRDYLNGASRRRSRKSSSTSIESIGTYLYGRRMYEPFKWGAGIVAPAAVPARPVGSFD